MPILLRPYQARAVEAARAAVREGAASVLVVAPTGGGKNTMAAYLAESAASKGRRTLFWVHREEIVNDLAQRARAAGIESVATFVRGKLTGPADAMLNVCSVQSLTARESFRPPADLLVIDEAHHSTCHTYRAVRGAYPGTPLVGLTATPARGDGTALGDVFDRMIVVATTKELTSQGWLVPCDVVGPLKRTKQLAGEPLELWERFAGRRQGVAFLPTIALSRDFAAALTERGIPAAHIDGKTQHAERAGAIAAFQAGRIRVLANVGVLTEGVDLPSAEVCLLARACDDVAAFLQCIGRVLRPSPTTGKKSALLIDVRGAVHMHGLPDEDRAFTLDGRGITRPSDAPAVRQCAACGACFAPCPVCPWCGIVVPPLPAPRVKHEQIHQLTEADIVKLQPKIDYYASLLSRGRQRGWKPMAAAMQFRSSYGFFPTNEIKRRAEAQVAEERASA